MKLVNFCFLLLFASSTSLFSQEKEVDLAIMLLENDKISEVNVDEDRFIASIGSITGFCKSKFADFPSSQKIGLLVVIHKSGKPSYTLYSNPKLAADLQASYLSELDKFEIENTKLVDFPLFFSVNCKNKTDIVDFEDFVSPAKQKMDGYKEADLATKFKLNQEFAINEILPILSAYQMKVSSKFAGVQSFGTLIQSTNFNSSQQMDLLTSKNKNYWRATLEMEVGNQLIPITKIAALIAQGEFDHAKKYIEIIQMFSDSKTIPDYYLEDLILRLDLFYKQLDKEISAGIKEHDAGNYAAAISIYSDILKAFPNSSWALYEKYFSENTMQVTENKRNTSDRSDWDFQKIAIYKHNPLYGMDVRASNGREAYLIYRRQEINSLFRKKEEKLNDLYKYAEIATDLGVYDFAAQLFWISATFNSSKSEESIHQFLYCLDKMGETEIKSNFKGNFDKIFKKIAAAKDKEMKESILYKSMKN